MDLVAQQPGLVLVMSGVNVDFNSHAYTGEEGFLRAWATIHTDVNEQRGVTIGGLLKSRRRSAFCFSLRIGPASTLGVVVRLAPLGPPSNGRCTRTSRCRHW